MPNKVYVVNKGAHDFQLAEKYGKLTFLTEGVISKYAVSKMHRIFESALEDSGPEDYILLTSLTIANSILCSMFALKHGKLNLLIWRDVGGPRPPGYVCRRILLLKRKEDQK